jgi:hypothetical protein
MIESFTIKELKRPGMKNYYRFPSGFWCFMPILAKSAIVMVSGINLEFFSSGERIN